MSQELIKRIEYNDEQIDLIKKLIAPKATHSELQLFLYQCNRTGLDALSRQIYAIHRNVKENNTWVSKMTIQTSIDGFRVIAERSGDYGGQDEPKYEYDKDGKLLKATVVVYRFRGQNRYSASVGVAYWNEYVPSAPSDMMWRKMPHIMLAKVAEALALRKAYPQDLSELYTEEEMQQADSITEEGEATEIPDEIEKNFLRGLVNRSTLDESQKALAHEAINECNDYKKYQEIQYKLESRQLQVDEVQNPSAKDINNRIKQTVG